VVSNLIVQALWATCANQPKDPARPIIEKLIVDALLDQLLQPERVTSILLALTRISHRF
jgi:hypothetical protein